MAMNASFLTALDSLCAQHGITRSDSSGKITLIDGDAAAQKFAIDGRWFGLKAQDFGKIVSINSKRFKVVGVLPNRPKYCIEGECLRTGKTLLLPRAVISQLESQRVKPASSPAATPTQQVPASVAPTVPAHNPYADVASF